MTPVLLMTGSPRRGGNCDDAANLMRAALPADGPPATLIRLHEHTVQPCRGCLRCQTEHRCPIRDDFRPLWEKVRQAATLVFFIPVYWCAPPGIMKNFIDRTVADFQLGNVMQGKTVHLVSIGQSAGFAPQEQIVDTWVRWLGGRPLQSRLRLIAFHRGELQQNRSAQKKLKQLAGQLRSRRPT